MKILLLIIAIVVVDVPTFYLWPTAENILDQSLLIFF